MTTQKIDIGKRATGVFLVDPATETMIGSATPLPVISAGSAGVTPTDRSGTITLGGTAQTAMAANAARKGFWLQNVSTGDLWINSLATAIVGQPSMKIPSGALYENPQGGCPTGAISIIGATTSQAYVAREW